MLSTARESLLSQALDVDSFGMKGISDDNDYIHNMGRAEQAVAAATKCAAEAVAQKSNSLIPLRPVEMLPQIAHGLAAPMGNIDQLTVVSTDGAGQHTRNVAGGFTEIDAVLKLTTGIDLRGLLGGFARAAAVARAAESTMHPPAPVSVPVGEPLAEEQWTYHPAFPPEHATARTRTGAPCAVVTDRPFEAACRSVLSTSRTFRRAGNQSVGRMVRIPLKAIGRREHSHAIDRRFDAREDLKTRPYP